MRFYHWKNVNGVKNFGDELNVILWNAYLHKFLNAKSKTLLLGIGTILNNRMPRGTKTAVFGSGVGYGKAPKLDDTYKIYCVRGPLSAQALGLAHSYAVTDPALLIRDVVDVSQRTKIYQFAYMPHWRTATKALNILCDDLGIKYIDPTSDKPEAVCREIAQTEVLLTEAMHGAIMADAYRVSWVPMKANADVKQFKWEDWCNTVHVKYEPHEILPIWDISERSVIRSLKQGIKKHLVSQTIKKVRATAKPILSREDIQERLAQQLKDRLQLLIEDLESGFFD